jgi:hypothetical protein
MKSPWPQPQRATWDRSRAHGMMEIMYVCRRVEWIFPPEAVGCFKAHTWWLRITGWVPSWLRIQETPVN